MTRRRVTRRRVLECLEGYLGAWGCVVVGYLGALEGSRVLGGVLGCLEGCSSAWGHASTKYLAFLGEYKSEFNVGNSSTNFHGFYSVKLLRYSDLGAK